MNKTADLCDNHPGKVKIVEPIFKDYGGLKTFEGEIYTLKLFEDNSLVKEMLESEGKGRILVIDGGASLRCALVGGNLAALAEKNGWAGLLVYGCVRDVLELAAAKIGIKALNSCPLKSNKRGEGQKGVSVKFAGVEFISGHYLYVDEDGIVVAERKLTDFLFSADSP